LFDERAIHFSSASNVMTQKSQDWWEQRRHKFRYQADGDCFRICISAAVLLKVKALLQRRGLGELEKWRGAQVLRDRILADPVGVSAEVLDRAEAISRAVNQAFERGGH